MQIKKKEIGKVFEKLQLEVRSTTHRYGWFTFEGKKILRVHYSHGGQGSGHAKYSLLTGKFLISPSKIGLY
jgi:hypothetical protein